MVFPKPMTYRHGGLYRLSVWSYWYRGIMWHFVEWLTLVLSPLPRWTVEKNGAVQRQLGWQIWWTSPGSNNCKQPPEIPFQMGVDMFEKPPVLGSILNIPKQLSQNTGVIAPPPMTLSQFGGSSFGMCVHHDAALICDDLSSTKHKIHDYVPQRSLSNHVFYASSLGKKTMLTTQLKMGCLWINNA